MSGDRLTLREVGAREFHVVEPGRHYFMAAPGIHASFDLDRARRDRYSDKLIGELTVKLDIAGTEALDDGTLSRADFDVSSARARSERALLVSRAAKSPEIPWHQLLEDFCARILAADREGQPSVDLRTVERNAAEAEILVHGLHLPARHPSIPFGDGGGLKSYIGLFVAGELARMGYRPGFFDWELAAEDHRDRLERLFGPDMPEIRYTRCEQPLSRDVDRLRRIVETDGLDYAVLDSVAFACDGPPEAAEVAGRYFQALRQLRIGTFNIAHINKSDTGDQRPFGSTFWHNGARATWFVKAADTIPNASAVSVGIFPRKRNLGALPAALGYEFAFDTERTTFRRVDVADVGDLADRLPIRQRMSQALRRGALDPAVLADELQADVETIKRTARRYKQQFTVLPGGRLALLERRTA